MHVHRANSAIFNVSDNHGDLHEVGALKTSIDSTNLKKMLKGLQQQDRDGGEDRYVNHPDPEPVDKVKPQVVIMLRQNHETAMASSPASQRSVQTEKSDLDLDNDNEVML